MGGKGSRLAELRAEAELRRSIIQAMPAGIVHVSADGAIQTANEQALELLGLSFDELTKKYTVDFEPETLFEDGSPCPVSEYPVTKALVTGEPQPAVTIGVRKPDGSLTWAVFTAVPVKDPETGTTTGAVVTFLDITKRKRAEEALRESETHLRSVVESAPTVIITADLDGTIRFANRSETAGRPSSGWVGASIYDRLPVSKVEILRSCVERVIGTRRPDGFEIQLERDEGFVAYSVRVGPIVDDREVTGISIISTDVSELKALQKRVLLSDRLASIGTLAAGVAHEINNPLTYTQIALQRAALALERSPRSTTDSEVADGIGTALEGLSRIARIVRDLGVSSRQPDEELQPVEITQVLDFAVRMAANETRHRARVVRNYSASHWVLGDKTRLGQVFLNLLVNAAQAIEGGDVAANEICITVDEAEAGRIRVAIRDTGCGIPEHTMPHIFEPFVTTKPVGEGTGLGLYLCHKIITSLGGELELHSDSSGTTATAHLPASRSARSGSPSKRFSTPERTAPGQMRVLVIDDEPNIRRVFDEGLIGHEVVLAASGREGIAKLGVAEYDLVFCDLIMPDLTGMDVYEYVMREIPHTRNRVVFMTGGAFTPRAREFVAGLDNELLEKPFTLEEVERRILRIRRQAEART